jgi:hypothetical protein
MCSQGIFFLVSRWNCFAADAEATGTSRERTKRTIERHAARLSMVSV